MIRTVPIRIGLLAGLACASTASATVVPWTQPSGSTALYTYSNGRSTDGLFGDPTFLPNGDIVFSPQAFVASNPGGVTDSTLSELEFDIELNPSASIDFIRVIEAGTYQIDGVGQVRVAATLVTTNLDFFLFEDATLTASQPQPITTTGSGAWTAEGEVDYVGSFAPWNRIRIRVTNELTATGIDASTIAKSEVRIVFPAPGSAALVALGGLVASRRRR